jgi:hypothetical protein
MEEWKSERDFVSRYLYPKIDEAVGVLGLNDVVKLYIDARVNGGIADLYAERSGKRLLVLEAKFKK